MESRDRLGDWLVACGEVAEGDGGVAREACAARASEGGAAPALCEPVLPLGYGEGGALEPGR